MHPVAGRLGCRSNSSFRWQRTIASTLYVSRMPVQRLVLVFETDVPVPRCFAHWYSHYFQVANTMGCRFSWFLLWLAAISPRFLILSRFELHFRSSGDFDSGRLLLVSEEKPGVVFEASSTNGGTTIGITSVP